MPSREFLEELGPETDAWARDGVVTAEQAASIRARYPPPGPKREGPVTIVLYATAGVLLGAAAIAFLAAQEGEPSMWPFLAEGLVLAAIGVAIHLLLRTRPLLGDALLVAALVPLAGGVFAPDGLLLWPFALAASVAFGVWRRGSFVPALAALAFTVASGAAVGEGFDAIERPWWIFVLLEVALVSGVLTLQRVVVGEDDVPTALVAASGLAFSMIPFVTDLVLDPRTGAGESEVVEITLGFLYLVLFGVGIVLRHRGVLLAGAIALGVDAIVFSFDVGGVLVGTGTLVALAAILIWQAEALRRYFQA